MLNKQTYTYLIGFKDGTSISFFVEKAYLADILELALYNSEYQVAMGTISGLIDSINLHSEEDLEQYDFYKEYFDKFVYDSHSRCNEEIF